MKKTKRFCVVCQRKRTFTLNKIIGHSECIECGARFARRHPPEELINKETNKVKLHYEVILKKQKKYISRLKQEILELRKKNNKLILRKS